MKQKVIAPINSRKADLLKGETGSTNEKFGIGILKKRSKCTAFLPAAYDQCSSSLSEMQDIMGRAFNDQLETGKFTTNSDDTDADKSKDIENEAFTWALNLYFLMTDLPELVSSGVNSNHFHLMANRALFGFGIMSSNIASDSPSKLENLLSSYNFARVQVAPDGDYLFSSVIFQLKQMVSSGNVELHSHLKAIGFFCYNGSLALLCLVCEA